eukprot:6212748-Pleurochrysis_carterae.AAC.1
MLLRKVHAALGVASPVEEKSQVEIEGKRGCEAVVFLPRCTLLPSIARHPVIAVYHLQPGRVYDAVVKIMSALEKVNSEEQGTVLTDTLRKEQGDLDSSRSVKPQQEHKPKKTAPLPKTCCMHPSLYVDDHTGDIFCENCGLVAVQGISRTSYENEQQVIQENSLASLDALARGAELHSSDQTLRALKSLRDHVQHICANPLMGGYTCAEDVISLLFILRRFEQKTSVSSALNFSASEIVACVLVVQHKHDLLRHHSICAADSNRPSFGQCKRCADIFYRHIDRRAHRCEPRIRKRLSFQTRFAPIWNTRMFITVAEARLDASKPVPAVRYPLPSKEHSRRSAHPLHL